jgi:hypothetical protein
MLSAFSGSFPLSSRFEDDCSISSYSNQVRITIITQRFENASLGMLVASCASQESDFDEDLAMRCLFVQGLGPTYLTL